MSKRKVNYEVYSFNDEKVAVIFSGPDIGYRVLHV